MVLSDSERRCHICGDLVWGPIWLDDEMPEGKCPDGSRVTPCSRAMRDAKRAAIWRKIAPEHFHPDGTIMQGRLVSVINKVAAAGYAPFTGEIANAQ